MRLKDCPGRGLTGASLGEKVAICVGYNDLDVGQLNYTALRWRKADPYSNDAVAGTSVDSWGDLQFDQSLDDVLADAGLTWLDVEGTPTLNTPNGVTSTRRIIKTEYYTTDGRLLGPGEVSRLPRTSRSMVLKRITFEDNSTRTLREPLGMGD